MKTENETPKNDFNATIGNTVLSAVLIHELENSFTGIGEVKGFEFTKVAETDIGYVYCVRTSEKSNHYEVFKKRKTPICIDFENKIYSETEFKEVYPNSKKFGISAWSVKNYETALERLNGLG